MGIVTRSQTKGGDIKLVPMVAMVHRRARVAKIRPVSFIKKKVNKKVITNIHKNTTTTVKNTLIQQQEKQQGQPFLAIIHEENENEDQEQQQQSNQKVQQIVDEKAEGKVEEKVDKIVDEIDIKKIVDPEDFICPLDPDPDHDKTWPSDFNDNNDSNVTLNNYDITTYEDFEDDLAHRDFENKKIPAWALDTKSVGQAAVYQIPQFQQNLAHLVFPKGTRDLIAPPPGFQDS